jgi:type IV secretory pathway TrbF-like protein
MVVADPIAQEELVARAYALADAPVRRQLDRYFAEPDNDPRAIAPKASRAVENLTILRLPKTDSTYELRWSERYYPRQQLATVRERSFRGLVTVETADRLPREALANNPLGLVITELTWTETTEED